MINVSVIIPFYNRAHTLENCINSVLNQTYKAMEIICVNDHSTDNSQTVVENIIRNNSCVSLINNAPDKKGAQSARNAGAHIAKGDWIVFLDSDDEWMPNFLEYYSDEIYKVKYNPNVVFYCNCYKLNGAIRHDKEKQSYLVNKNIWKLPNVAKNKSYLSLLKNPAPMFQGMIIHKSLLQKSDFFNEEVISYQEWDSSIRLAKNGGIFVHIKKPLFIYYVGEKNTISNDFSKDIIGQFDMIERYKQELLDHFGEKYLARRYKRILFMFLSGVGDYEWNLNEKLVSSIKSIICNAKVGIDVSYFPPLYRL